MRIISGKHKGRKILPPKGLPVRPTTDLCKESLFNILQNHFYLHEVNVLDLFAGTGNMSYEFSSRGAIQVTAIEQDAKCISYIKQTTTLLDLSIIAIKTDVFQFLEKSQVKYDIIFADPPYEMASAHFLGIIEKVFEKNMLNDNGFLIIEHSKYTDLSEHPHLFEQRQYGGTIFSFFENNLLE
jgi:16S rRNA (guanine966-N2)-methyltransferase